MSQTITALDAETETNVTPSECPFDGGDCPDSHACEDVPGDAGLTPTFVEIVE